MLRIVAAVMVWLVVAPWAESAEPPRPNILFLYADDLGYGDLHCYGRERAITPRLDRLATEGSRFTQFYVSHCLCSPTRASVLTGQYPSRHRIFGHLSALDSNTSRGIPHWLDVKAPSMPRALQKAGYRTAHFGKWHLGGGSGAYRDGKLFINHPDAPPVVDYGFTVARSTFGNSPTWKAAEPVDAPHEIYPYNDLAWQTYSSRAIADASIEFLTDHAKRSPQLPFLIHAWFKDVHTPMKPTAEMSKPFADLPEPERTHLAMLRELDTQIGRVLDKLDELKLADNTLVLFTSDNGTAQGRGGSNAPLRASKWTLYEGGIRVPFIVRLPSRVPAGRVDKQSVLNICDFAPTFCKLAGTSMGEGYRPDGIDITPALFGQTVSRPLPQFWHHPMGGDRSPPLAVREGNWKLLTDPSGRRLELYDLTTDIGEKENLAEKQPAVADRLRTALLAWYRTLPAQGN